MKETKNQEKAFMSVSVYGTKIGIQYLLRDGGGKVLNSLGFSVGTHEDLHSKSESKPTTDRILQKLQIDLKST